MEGVRAQLCGATRPELIDDFCFAPRTAWEGIKLFYKAGKVLKRTSKKSHQNTESKEKGAGGSQA